MQIGIIGSGYIGGTLATHFSRLGHEVMVSSRNPAALAERVGELGPSVVAGSGEDAARFGDLVVLAIHWEDAVMGSAMPAADSLIGKMVVDAMNPYKRNGEGGFHECGPNGSSGRVAAMLPGARLVKAFNTIYWIHLRDQADGTLPVGSRRAIFVASDDTEAKAEIADLILAMGFDAIDTGGLVDGGRSQEPNTPVYNRILTGDEARALDPERLQRLSGTRAGVGAGV